MNNQQLSVLKHRYVARGAICSTERFAARAENAELWDADGKRMIDFAGGIGVLNIGHRHPRVIAAIKDQLEQLVHTSAGVISYAPYVQLAERLCALTPTSGEARKAFLVNSGAEALENAVKIARAATGRSGIITFEGSFHGRTLMTLAMTGKVSPYKSDFGPMPAEVFHCPYPNPDHGVSEKASLDALRMRFKTDIPAERVAAIVIEPVQGEGGFNIASPAYLQALRALCDAHGIIMIADEVQSGFARTGKLFAIEHSGITPDIVTMAKSLANGMPLAAVVGNATIMDASGPGSLGGTYAGNPVACAAALAVIEVIEEEDILQRSMQLGDTLFERFTHWAAQYPHVAYPRHLGAMAAFELVEHDGTPAADKAKALVHYALEHDLLLLSCGLYGNVIRILVPITVSPAVLEEGLNIIASGLSTL